jgi:hypothetical protein
MNQNNVEIGGYFLGQQVGHDPELTEISAQEYAVLPKTFMAEQILKAPDATFLGLRWSLLLGTIDGRIYKLSAQFVAASDDEADAAFTKAAHFCEVRFGASSKSIAEFGSFWKTTFGNVVVDRQHGYGMHCVNFHCTSGSPRRSVLDGDWGRVRDRWDQAAAQARARESDIVIPRTLLRNCARITSRTHKLAGFKALPAMVSQKDSMVALAFIPDARVMMRSIWAASKLRIAAWAAVIVSVGLTILVSRWCLAGTLVFFLIDRYLAQKDHEFWAMLAAMLLALDVLANNFASWGTAFPGLASAATTALGGSSPPSDFWLNYYLPRRRSLTAEELASFGPGSERESS